MAKARGLDSLELALFDFDLDQINREAAEIVGHGLLVAPEVVIMDHATLACIQTKSNPPRIYLHSIFNVPWLPIQVMRHVLIHEHLHLVVPRREVEPGIWMSHPPEFWEQERTLVPYADIVWRWVNAEWGRYILHDDDSECVRVRRGWRKRQNEDRKTRNDFYREAGVKPPLGGDFTWEEICEGWGHVCSAQGHTAGPTECQRDIAIEVQRTQATIDRP